MTYQPLIVEYLPEQGAGAARIPGWADGKTRAVITWRGTDGNGNDGPFTKEYTSSREAMITMGSIRLYENLRLINAFLVTEARTVEMRVTTPELELGDIVLSEGRMRILLDTPPKTFHGNCAHPLRSVAAGLRYRTIEPELVDGQLCYPSYSWIGTVLNVTEVTEYGVVPRSYLYDSDRHDNGPGHGREDRWTVQGNSLAYWDVERAEKKPQVAAGSP